MVVLVGCEESQAVTIAFRNKGHEAYSCDLQECSGGHPEWHFTSDVFKVIEDLKPDMLIGHPPCTYLTVSANRWLKDQPQRKSGALVGEERRKAQKESINFFIKMLNCDVPKICLENPTGAINSIIKPTQIINPYYFGDEYSKQNCLWLRGLQPLIHAKEVTLFDKEITHVSKGEIFVTSSGRKLPKWYSHAPHKDRAKIRSKTFPGIAQAMADQWG